MAWPTFASKNTTLLHQLEDTIARYTKEQQESAHEKEQCLKRQVEIWSIGSASSAASLEGEYKDAAGRVSYLVKKLLCLDEHLRQLKLARYHCENGDCRRAEEVLAVQDPCKVISDDNLQVDHYQQILTDSEKKDIDLI